MTLVKDGDTVKAYLSEPMWGNASRLQWSLFFLATPVMFYSAYVFHRRSIKEIYAMWRRGSSASVKRRLTRFGSMNLLISSGVSVAYFSSIALLGIAAAQRPSENNMGDSTTYFDSVVFLTMFLLAGKAFFVTASEFGLTRRQADSLKHTARHGRLTPLQHCLLSALNTLCWLSRRMTLMMH
jgi:cation transport ATPase